MARTKEIEVEGHKYKLKSLTMDQVEEFWDDQNVSMEGRRARCWQNLLYSLHNAGSNITLAELRPQLTIDGYNKLYDAALEVSYLKVDDPGEQKAETETPTSSSSVAA